MGKHKNKEKKKLQKQLKYSLKALLSVDPDNYGKSDKKKERLNMFANHVMSNPSVEDNTKFYRKNVLTSDVKLTRKGKLTEIPYTNSDLINNSQQWLTYTIGSLIRRGIIKQASTFVHIL